MWCRRASSDHASIHPRPHTDETENVLEQEVQLLERDVSSLAQLMKDLAESGVLMYDLAESGALSSLRLRGVGSMNVTRRSFFQVWKSFSVSPHPLSEIRGTLFRPPH